MIVGDSMISILIKHDVADYSEWKVAFDAHDSVREEFGQQGYRLFTNAEDGNHVVAVLEWDSVENARRFLEESDVEAAMADAGVVSEPEISFLDEQEARQPQPVA